MKKIKIYVVGNAIHYADWIAEKELVSSPEDADMLLFTGGEDVDPTLYGEDPHPATFSRIERDIYEINLFKDFEKKLKVGICRGNQLLTVANNGRLIQHVTNHAIGGTHKIITKDGEIFDITSTHHQMSLVTSLIEGEDYELIAYAEPSLSGTYEIGGGEKINIKKEPEILWFPKTKSLGIQGHPEHMYKEEKVILFLNNLLWQKLNGNR